jgi:hypothetical protein
MDKRSLVVCAGVLVVGLGGCTIGEDPTVSSSSPSPSESPAASQPFNNPVVKEKDKDKDKEKDKKAASKTGSGDRVPGLLKSTDPAERAKQVQAKINKTSKDPFSSLPPVISFRTPAGNEAKPMDPEPNQGRGQAPSPSSNPPSNNPVPRPSIPNFPRVASNPPKPLPRPTVIGRTPSKNPPKIAVLPPLPEPTLAKAVEVTGVVIVNGVPQAIVKAPNEATTRYVQAGQRLSNGQILVKRIEMNGGSDPVVILEQNGVEVARAVGEKPPSPTSPPTASELSLFRFA